MLTDAQIDRYSRQIILPEVGGLGQERLLAARVRLLAEIEDLTPALNYLVGAGLGNIELDCPAAGGVRRAIAAMAQLNPEVRIEQGTGRAGDERMLVVLAAANGIIEAARRINQSAGCTRVIFARLGEPYRVAVLVSRPPCLACADADLMAPIESRGAFAPAVAMVAAAETIKCLLADSPGASRVIEFSGYESSVRQLEADSYRGCTVCG